MDPEGFADLGVRKALAVTEADAYATLLQGGYDEVLDYWFDLSYVEGDDRLLPMWEEIVGNIEELRSADAERYNHAKDTGDAGENPDGTEVIGMRKKNECRNCKGSGCRVASASKKNVVDRGGNPRRFRNLTQGGNVTERYWRRSRNENPGFEKDREDAAVLVFPRYMSPSQADVYIRWNKRSPGSVDRAGYDCPKGTRSNVRFITEDELRQVQLENLARGREIRRHNIEMRRTSRPDGRYSPEKGRTVRRR